MDPGASRAHLRAFSAQFVKKRVHLDAPEGATIIKRLPPPPSENARVERFAGRCAAQFRPIYERIPPWISSAKIGRIIIQIAGGSRCTLTRENYPYPPRLLCMPNSGIGAFRYPACPPPPPFTPRYVSYRKYNEAHSRPPCPLFAQHVQWNLYGISLKYYVLPRVSF